MPVIYFYILIFKVGQILEDIGRFEKDYKKELSIMDRYLDRVLVNRDLRVRIRNYLEYMHM